jgi:hypothetical protein
MALTVKQGATLQLVLTVANDDGTPFDLTMAAVTASVRTANRIIVDALLPLEPNSTPGQLTVVQPTDAWPIGPLICDLKFVAHDSGVVVKSSTFSIVVISAVTR